MSEPRSIFPADSAGGEERLYFNMIDAALKSREDRIISNGKPAHAVYLINKLLECAQRSVRIYTGRLSRTFDGVLAYADPVIAMSAIAFLGKEGSELSIVIADEPDVEPGRPLRDHPFLKTILDADIRGEVRVSKAEETDRERFQYHFLVVDDEAMRIEIDTKKAQAYVNFGNPPFGQQLRRVFDEFERNGTPLLPVPEAV